MARQGLFVGLLTLDFLYLAAGSPTNNQKIVATDYTVAAGGPATNAAVTFSYLGDRATLLGVVGTHAITHLIRADLQSHNVEIKDLDSARLEPPPVSSIIVTQATGERSVISINATKSQGHTQNVSPDIVFGIDIVLIDGHQMQIGQTMVELAKSKNIPVVIDGGSWKPGFEKLLPFVDYAVCSANFYPPGCQNEQEAIIYLSSQGIPHIAITQGEKPIHYISQGTPGWVEVPKIKAVDTLGAGDVFHGAFCHYILRQNFTAALASAAKVASLSCQFFGTRRWMESSKKPGFT
ncbi:sugar kinase [Argonema galeatum]|uniref:sugar kinase n=1 Tax=Argonema galeatum TaxID=2942762 RepID=UPI002011A4C3|nr:sugar kinase [Argonema galeatum]MCL1464399.1 sugar kinase [Argonema galeatum A003/A1]